jgi:SAM-dependent methyltransferase
VTLKPETEAHLLAHHRDFERFAELMEETFDGRFDAVFWGALEAYGPEQVRRVLDLGTGPGLLLPVLAERFPEAYVVGVDGQPEMLKRAKQREGARVQVFPHDLAHPPIDELDDGSCDVIIASMLVHELTVPTALLEECARLLAPGGLLAIYDWCRMPLAAYAGDERIDALDQFTHFSEHCRYTPDDYAFLAAQSGLDVREVMSRHGGRRVLLLASKP